MTLNEAKQALTALQRKMAAYDHAQSLIYYDGCTTAPKGTAANRGVALSVLSEESYKFCTGKDTVELLEFLDAQKDELDEKEKRIVYLLLKDIRNMAKIPMDEYVAYEELLVEADDVWHTAKETSDFALFEPYLQKIFDTERRFAGYVEPEKDPYDHLLNEYEEGLTKETCDRFFATLKERLVPLIHKVGEMPPVDTSCIKGYFLQADQEKLAHWLMRTMAMDLDHIGLSSTEHPFTTSFGSNHDVRITTHYYPENVSFSMYSVVHEGGHALYDSGSADEFAYTALDGGVSMGIHESQSRFYENILGRSRAFCNLVLPVMKALFPQMGAVTEEEFYKAINVVEPSLIRTEADEVTYCLHVMIRYEIEKRVMAGELAVHDIPAEWNRLYKEYLGIDVPDDKHGCLQDSHWSGGLVGYFPSYALGSAYGAQFLRKMKEDIDVDALLAKGDFAPINAWLKDKIWQYGRLYTPAQILDNVLGEPFDPNYYLDYLEEKCKAVYGF
ncbi:MAG: carboxypeptidase M32 [Firmicutes bacterium]|nr:carboxypeptidase M32 [Bacillota bacterium]